MFAFLVSTPSPIVSHELIMYISVSGVLSKADSIFLRSGEGVFPSIPLKVIFV